MSGDKGAVVCTPTTCAVATRPQYQLRGQWCQWVVSLAAQMSREKDTVGCAPTAMDASMNEFETVIMRPKILGHYQTLSHE